MPDNDIRAASLEYVAFLQGLVPDPLAHPETPESQAIVAGPSAPGPS